MTIADTQIPALPPGTVPLVPPVGPWLLQEDEALKTKLQNGGPNNLYAVPNYGQGGPSGVPTEPVAVFFRFPDDEIRTRTFPHLAVDLVTVQREDDRAHRAAGHIVPQPTETATPPEFSSLVSDDLPLPYSLIYQIAAYARQPWHDRWLSILMYQLFPQNFGFLDMADYDGTKRRADLLDVVRRDTRDQNQKRLYRNIFTVAISSEMYVYQVQSVMNVLSVKETFDYTIETFKS